MLAILLLLASPSFALDKSRTLTQYAHRIWQIQQGLPEPTIYSIHQSSDGYIWLGTQHGAVRFDGVRFARINKLPTASGEITLTDLEVKDIAEDSAGNLYLATDGRSGSGVIQIHQGLATKFLPDQQVHCLLIDSHETLYAATNLGLFRFNPGIQQFDQLKDLPPNLQALTESRWGGDQVLIAAGATTLPGNRLTILSTTKTETYDLQSLSPTATIQALAVTPDNTLWIASSQGLISLDADHHEHRYTTANGLADDFVYCLHPTSDNIVWAGTRDGFSRIAHASPGQSEFDIDTFHAKDGLSQSTVYAIFQDKEGSLWIGSKHGLDEFFDGRIFPITVREGLPSNDTGPILQTADHTIYIGTLDAGLARYDGHRFTRITTADGLPSNRIQSLAESPAHELYIGTDKGLAVLHDDKAATVRIGDSPESNNIRSLAFDHQGMLHIATAAGLASLKDGQVNDPDDGTPLGPILVRKDGSLIVSTENGRLYSVVDHGVAYIPLDAPRPRAIDALYEDPDGVLWIGTIGGGLRSFDGKTTRQFSMRDGLFDDDIFAILSDAKDRLWLACSKGVFSVSRQNLLDFAAGKTAQITCTPFSPTDALRTIECKPGVEPAAALMNDGRLWFATTRGVVVLDSTRPPRHLTPPQVVIEEAAVDGRAESAAKLAALPAGRKNLAFRYTALSFIVAPRITFRYQLEGFDKSWIDAGNRREAFYTNLGPGHYTFRVQALNADGSWSDPTDIASAAIPLSIAPHFYQHWWFIPSLVLIALGLGAIAFQLRITAIRHRMQIVINERSRIARELHDTLLQGFSGITMEMQALSVRLPDSNSRQTLEEIIRDAGACLREARRSVAGLRELRSASPITGFPALLEATARQLVAGTPVHLTVNLPANAAHAASLPANIEFNLMRIASEAITNTLKHAHASTLQLDFSVQPDHLLLDIRDNGRGFSQSHGASHGNAGGAGPKAGHYGLIGMRERAIEINATLNINSAPNEGTLITVRVPLKTTTAADEPVAAVGGRSNS